MKATESAAARPIFAGFMAMIGRVARGESASMRHRRYVVVTACAFVTTLAVTSPVRVHPHVFADATLEVTVGTDREVRSLGHVWRFDDLFSSTVLLEFDANSDLVLDDTELKEVASVVHDSLADFSYFQIVTADGDDVEMRPPEKLTASYENDQLIILFQSEPATPLKMSGKVSFGIYDPTFYTAIDFYDDDNMMVRGMPESCTRTVVRPDPDEALASNQDTLTEEFFNDPGGNDYGKLFATRLEISCGASG
jgi:ABC-type uncharacterized transport system substrate-binding protein